MKTAFKLMPLPKGAKIPKGRQHTGFFYRSLNRRIQLTLRADGKVTVLMRRLLSREEAQAGGPLDTPTQMVRGRVLHTSLVLSMEAVSAFAHFASEVLMNGGGTASSLTYKVQSVHGKRPKNPAQ